MKENCTCKKGRKEQKGRKQKGRREQNEEEQQPVKEKKWRKATNGLEQIPTTELQDLKRKDNEDEFTKLKSKVNDEIKLYRFKTYFNSCYRHALDEVLSSEIGRNLVKKIAELAYNFKPN